jgi:Domain of unknown function (DUF6249)
MKLCESALGGRFSRMPPVFRNNSMHPLGVLPGDPSRPIFESGGAVHCIKKATQTPQGDLMPPAVFVPAAPPRFVRRLVLGAALFLALAVALGPRTPSVHAQPSAATAQAPSKAPSDAPPAKSTTRSATINIKADDRSVTIDTTEKSTPGKHDTDADVDADADADASSGPVTGIGKGKHGKRVRVGVFGDDRDYDSFSDFVHTEPGLAFMVVSIVALVFLSPVLAIALILWYRMRKARMLNETMLRLAEKGVVPPAEALSALAGNSSAPLAAAPSAAPIYEQAKQIRRRAAWSDLRKGVILGGIGLGLSLFSMFDDGTPNGLGLVLLFVGVGYLVLWWYEERQFAPGGGGAGTTPTAPPSGGTDGKI